MVEAPLLAQQVKAVREVYGSISRPLPGQLLKILRLDKVFHSGEGSWLTYYNTKGEERRVIDYLGGYGATLLGHAPPELVEVAKEALEKKTPIFAQMSIPAAATACLEEIQLALKEEVQEPYKIHLVNTGTEATEAALKHCRMVYLNRLNQFQKEFQRRVAQIKSVLKNASDHPVIVSGNDRLGSLGAALAQFADQNEKALQNVHPLFLAAEKGYHGKTLNALQVTWNPKFREPFLGEEEGCRFFPIQETEVEELMKEGVFQLVLPKLTFAGEITIEHREFSRFAGLFLEPIQGEGGIQPLPIPFLIAVRTHCDTFKIPLILDEIQSGTYRTGHFLASGPSGVIADYILLGKALGGGMVKVAALLIRKEVYQEEFGLLHTSTYAEDGFSSQVAARSLVLLKHRAAEIIQKGNALKDRLVDLQKLFPTVVMEVRGKGLMLGIEFPDYTYSANVGLQLLARTGYLSYVYAGFLLNKWQIRVGAPLSHPNTLRIQPPVCISTDQVSRLMEGLNDLCEILYCQDLYKLIEYTLPPAYRGLRDKPGDFREGMLPMEPRDETLPHVGFVTHFIHEGTVHAAVPAFRVLDRECIEYLLERILPISAPIILGSKSIKSKTGKSVRLTLAGLCITSAMARRGLKEHTSASMTELCHQAVELLQDQGAQVVGMGQFSSILTQNCKSIPNGDLGLTSGNSFTTYLGIQALLKKLADLGRSPEKEVLGLIGAGGNIGSIYAQYFSRHTTQIRLLGSPGPRGYQSARKVAQDLVAMAAKRLKDQKGQPSGELETFVYRSESYKKTHDQGVTCSGRQLLEMLENEYGDQMPIRAIKSLDEVQECGIVVVATSAAEPFLGTEHLCPGAVVCDISVPVNCKPELLEEESGVEVILGGVAALPGGEAIPLKGFPLADGNVFGCLGETLLLGLEESSSSFSYGRIHLDQVEQIGEIARKHGFSLIMEKRNQSY